MKMKERTVIQFREPIFIPIARRINVIERRKLLVSEPSQKITLHVELTFQGEVKYRFGEVTIGPGEKKDLIDWGRYRSTKNAPYMNGFFIKGGYNERTEFTFEFLYDTLGVVLQ